MTASALDDNWFYGRPMHYIEVDGVPAPEPDFIAWSRWFSDTIATDARRVAKTYRGDGAVTISTVFLGSDHNFWGGQPILYETMVFFPGHELDEWQHRYATREEAKAGHDAAVALVDAAIAGERDA